MAGELKMDVREKLVGLLKTQFYDEYEFEEIADWLIAHGVTVQSDMDVNAKSNWIPVTDSLPEVGSRVIARGEKGGVFVVKSEGITTGFGRMDGTSKYRSFTHWTPLPEPQKGE